MKPSDLIASIPQPYRTGIAIALIIIAVAGALRLIPVQVDASGLAEHVEPEPAPEPAPPVEPAVEPAAVEGDEPTGAQP